MPATILLYLLLFPLFFNTLHLHILTNFLVCVAQAKYNKYFLNLYPGFTISFWELEKSQCLWETKKNPQTPEKTGKYYANAVNAGKFTIKNIAKEISGRSSLTKGDIENVLENLLDELPTFLKLGLSVQLGDFGTMRLTLSSERLGLLRFARDDGKYN